MLMVMASYVLTFLISLLVIHACVTLLKFAKLGFDNFDGATEQLRAARRLLEFNYQFSN